MIWSPADRMSYAIYWGDEFEKLDKIVKAGHGGKMSKATFANYKKMQEFANHVDEILSLIADRLQPMSFDDWIKKAFD
jgi:hypothetical protein